MVADIRSRNDRFARAAVAGAAAHSQQMLLEYLVASTDTVGIVASKSRIDCGRRDHSDCHCSHN